MTVGSCSAGKKMLLAVAQKEPAGVYYLDCEDLWLKRISAVKLYDLEGFESFCKHITTIRSTCYCYIDLIRGFSIDQKQILLED